MNRREILAFINDAIREENGSAVKMDSKFTDSGLDFMGIVFVMLTIDTEFHIIHNADQENFFRNSKIKPLVIRDLVNKCLLSSINQKI